MKTLVSLVFGVALLFGAATFGLPSGSASAHSRHHNNDWYYKHHHHHHHHHYRHNQLSW